MSDARQAVPRPDDAALARALKGEATPEEEAAVRAWRSAAPPNETEFQELTRLVGWSARLAARHAAPPRPVAADLIGRSHAAPAPAAPTADGVIPLRRRRTAWIGWGLAAAALVALAIAPVVLRDAARGRAAPTYGVRTVVTTETETAALELVDGSVIRLAPSSRLHVLETPGRREVALEGRGFFAVTRREGVPFVIRTNAGEVTVLGTRFDVEARGRDLRLVVVEGRVALSTARQRTEVTAGEMGRVVDGRTETVLKVPDVASFVEWTGRFLAFQSTPLRDAALEIERVYGVRVEIPNDEVARRTITAWFWDRSLAEVAEVVCLAVAARCTVTNGVVRVQP